jgi:hypothetical protein
MLRAVRTGYVRLGHVRSIYFRLYTVRSSSVLLGQVRSVYVRICHIMSR